LIKLCLGLHLLAGASYLDLRFGYNVTTSSVHCSAWQTLDAINNSSKHKYLDTLKSPIYSTVEEGSQLELGFAILDENDN